MVSETEVDDNFPEDQFLIEVFRLQFRFDQNRNSGRIMLYARDIPQLNC